MSRIVDYSGERWRRFYVSRDVANTERISAKNGAYTNSNTDLDYCDPVPNCCTTRFRSFVAIDKKLGR